MANELRKTLGRNMRYANMNEQIDNQIKELEKRTFFDVNAKAQIDALKQQRENNLQYMSQPMTAEEYDEYDDNGEYIGDQSSMPASDFTTQDSDIGQTAIDGVNHFAQGASLGWSDELNGVIGGAGYTNENTLGEYTNNIGMSIGANTIGNQIGNWAFGGGNNMYRAGRTMMNAFTQSIPYGYNYFRKKDEDE